MLVTKEDLEYRLKDGRWHQVSPSVFNWFSKQDKYEIQYRRFSPNWVNAVAPSTQANTKCRIRLKSEYVVYPPSKM